MVGNSIKRVDAREKVLGRARFVEDMVPANSLVAYVKHSAIANGRVLSIDTKEAEALPGVVKIVTCFDVPDIQFATPGHPWSMDPDHRDVPDRKLLNSRVRHYGDCIAAVVADNEVTAQRALKLLKVEYEQYPALLTPQEALAPGASVIHEERPDNILKETVYEEGDWDKALSHEDLVCVKKTYTTLPVQHCHIENPGSFAYMDGDRIVVVASTQIPHIMRRVIGQALGIPWGQIRVVKPYVGGGFGNKQDVIYEPLNAWLTTLVGGRCVYLPLSREETFHSSRTRHGIEFELETWVHPDGTIAARRSYALSNQGGYASHGHTICANATSAYRNLYHQEALRQVARTVYTNICTGGAMRGYGIPQINFAMESHMEDVANSIGMDPIAFRRKNMMRLGDVDAGTGIVCHSNGLDECISKGKDYIHWDEKRAAYRNQTGNIRRGVGMAIFSYKTGAWPSAMEIGSCRIVLNQDGSVQVQMGATEIGQGADTAFTQMAAETLGISTDKIHVVSQQDTDLTPFDTGAYASRQSYVSGAALKQTCLLFRQKVFHYLKELSGNDPEKMDIRGGVIVHSETGETLMPLDELAVTSFYHPSKAQHITAESTRQCADNTYALGCCFAEIEVNIAQGRISVLDIINVHDSGRLINPALAAAQVHGGMAMGIGYALSEHMQYDKKTGALLNGNLLDYKLPTAMDVPNLSAAFVETDDPSSPYGNKSLGEPPAIPVAAAIRNALLYATGVAVDAIPLNPQRLIAAFTDAGLLSEEE